MLKVYLVRFIVINYNKTKIMFLQNGRTDATYAAG